MLDMQLILKNNFYSGLVTAYANFSAAILVNNLL